MLKSEEKKNLLLFFFIFFNFFIKKYNQFSNYNNIFFFFKLKRFFKISKFYGYFCRNRFKFYFSENTSLSASFEDHSTLVIDKLSVKKSFYLTKSNKNDFLYSSFLNFNKKFYGKLLNFFFLNSFLPNNSFFPKTGFFYMFFFKNSKGSSYLININKVLNR
jgi:hypothetical protein